MQQELASIQEARSFVGRKGPQYVNLYATKEEKHHFEGSLYIRGIPNKSLITNLASPPNLK